MAIHPNNQTIGVCGAGQMGAAAAVCFSRAGYKTILWLRDPDKIISVQQTLKELDAWMTKHVGPPPSMTGSTNIVTDLATVDSEATVIVDCIAEVMAEKVNLFRGLPKSRVRKALFLTTTSGLSITELGKQSETGPQLAGAHFWNPPHLMPLVEVVRGGETTEETMTRAIELIRAIGKIPVRVNADVPGFIGNRLLHALWREAINLVQRGIASPEDVDRVARLTFGLRSPAVGPLENMDLVGLDLIHTIHQYLLADLADDHQPLPLLTEHVNEKTLGMKTGRGFYDWQARDSKELIDRRNKQIVHQLAFLRELDAL